MERRRRRGEKAVAGGGEAGRRRGRRRVESTVVNQIESSHRTGPFVNEHYRTLS